MAYYKKRRGYGFGSKRKFSRGRKRSSSSTKAFNIGFGAGLLKAGKSDKLNSYLKGKDSRSYISGLKAAEKHKTFDPSKFEF